MTRRRAGGTWRWAGAVLVAAACGGGDASTTGLTETDVPGLQGACDEPVYVDLVVTGQVFDDGVPAASGVSVRIEERTHRPGTIHGQDTTASDGSFAIDAAGLPMIDRCLGWATSFYVVADDGARTAEWGINSVLSGAWQRGEDSVSLEGIPLDLAD